MIGMILVTHGRLAEELRSAMEHVVGAQRNVKTICIGPDDDIDNRRAEMEACIRRWGGVAHRYVRRNAVKPGDFDDGTPER
jgi:mannose/fructose-specific phosphotransferase system component IIA